MPPLDHIIGRHNTLFHFYADDAQLYLPVHTTDSCSLVVLKDCFDDIES